MSSDERKPVEARPPDVEIGATFEADALRFEREPDAEVRFRGASIERTESGSARKNLPDEVEAGKTYRDVRVGWRAAAWVENAIDEDEKLKGESTRGHSGGGRKE